VASRRRLALTVPAAAQGGRGVPTDRSHGTEHSAAAAGPAGPAPLRRADRRRHRPARALSCNAGSSGRPAGLLDHPCRRSSMNRWTSTVRRARLVVDRAQPAPPHVQVGQARAPDRRRGPSRRRAYAPAQPGRQVGRTRRTSGSPIRLPPAVHNLQRTTGDRLGPPVELGQGLAPPVLSRPCPAELLANRNDPGLVDDEGAGLAMLRDRR
jgi:hypothetical protein